MEGGKELLIAAEIILALTLFIIHALSSSDNEWRSGIIQGHAES